MTFILDPGNDPNSYSDAVSRQWKATAGLWKGDSATWQATAATWQSRANQAYDSGTWGTGSLWSTDSAIWSVRANQAYDSGTWGTGTLWSTDSAIWQSRANQAYDSGTWGSGNLWSADAHSDPSVYTNRYNTGFTDGAASKTTTSQSAALSGTWPNSTTSYSGSLGSLTAPRAGDAHVSAVIYVNYSVGTHGQARILVNGGVVATATQTGASSGSGLIGFAADWTGTVANGDAVTVQLASDGGTTLSSGTLKLTVGSV